MKRPFSVYLAVLGAAVLVAGAVLPAYRNVVVLKFRISGVGIVTGTLPTDSLLEGRSPISMLGDLSSLDHLLLLLPVALGIFVLVRLAQHRFEYQPKDRRLLLVIGSLAGITLLIWWGWWARFTMLPAIGFWVSVIGAIALIAASFLIRKVDIIQSVAPKKGETLPARMAPIKPSSVIRIALWGMAGFGIGFALEGGIRGSFGYLIPKFPDEYFVVSNILLYSLAGGLGGAIVGFTGNSKGKTLLFILASAVGCGIGWYFIRGAPWKDLLWDVVTAHRDYHFIFLLQFIVMGAFTGALLGSVQRDWRQSARLALAGAMGFGLGELIFNIYIPLEHNTFTHLAISVFQGLAGGAIIGLCLGLAMEWRGLFGKKQSATPTSEEIATQETTTMPSSDVDIRRLLDDLKNENNIEAGVKVAEALGEVKNFGEEDVVSALASAAVKAAQQWEVQRMTVAMMQGVRPEQIIVYPHADASRITIAAVTTLRKLAGRKDDVGQKAKGALQDIRKSIRNPELTKKMGF